MLRDTVKLVLRFGGGLKHLYAKNTHFLYYWAFLTNDGKHTLKDPGPIRHGDFWPHKLLQSVYNLDDMYLPPPCIKKGGHFFRQRIQFWDEIYWESLLIRVGRDQFFGTRPRN